MNKLTQASKKQGLDRAKSSQDKPKRLHRDVARQSDYQPQSIQFQQCGGGRRIIRKKTGGD